MNAEANEIVELLDARPDVAVGTHADWLEKMGPRRLQARTDRMSPDPLAELREEITTELAYAARGVDGSTIRDQTSAIVDWLRAHRAEVLAALGGELETTYAGDQEGTRR